MSAPASARAMATACPMPRVPPVMTAVCPSSENMLLTFVLLCGAIGKARVVQFEVKIILLSVKMLC